MAGVSTLFEGNREPLNMFWTEAWYHLADALKKMTLVSVIWNFSKHYAALLSSAKDDKSKKKDVFNTTI